MANDSAGGWVLLGLLGLAIYSCSGSESEDYSEEDEYAYSDEYSGDEDGYNYGYEERAEFDEGAARSAAESEISSSTYEDIRSPYGCTDDCSGHNAGFAWAAEGNYDGGVSNSQSFDEGQQAYEEAIEERVDEMRNDYESGEEPDY